MAYKEHGMWEVLEVLEVLKRLHAGEGIRATARHTGRDRNTVKRYRDAVVSVGPRKVTLRHSLKSPEEATGA